MFRMGEGEFAMCTDSTKQEILFLRALSGTEIDLSESDLAREMRRLADVAQWGSYLHNTPKPIKELCRLQEQFGRVRRVAPARWVASSEALAYVEKISTRYISEDINSKLRRAACPA